MADFAVVVDGVTYDVKAPDKVTADAWAKQYHQQQLALREKALEPVRREREYKAMVDAMPPVPKTLGDRLEEHTSKLPQPKTDPLLIPSYRQRPWAERSPQAASTQAGALVRALRNYVDM